MNSGISFFITLALMISGVFFGKAYTAGRELHVAKSGHDTATGRVAAPFLTIGRAAREAKPGDTVVIQAGVYREQVALPRGGTAEDARIAFVPAPGQLVVVKGSEPLTGWQRESGGVWRANVVDARFGGFNPFHRAGVNAQHCGTG